MEKLKVALLTPTRQLTRAEVDMVIAPSVQGQVAILPDHRPLLADLQEGPVVLRTGQQSEVYAISGGFLEVDRNHVRILAETAEHSLEIDVERATAALSDAQAKSKKLDAQQPEYVEECARLRRAQVRLAITQGKLKS